LRRINKIRLFSICLLLLVGNSLFAQSKHELDTIYNNWNFRLGPYFWFVGLKGEIVKPPVPSHLPYAPPKYSVDVKFKDIRNSIKWAAMITGQYRNKHFVTQFNFSSLIIESEAITPKELLLQDNIISLNYFSGDFGAGYRIIKNEKFEFDALLGLKFVYFKIGAVTNILGKKEVNGSRNHLWIDPIIGTNFKYRPHRKVEIVLYGDIGPSWVTMDFNYQLIGGVNYLFTKLFFISLGYRQYYLKVPDENAIFRGSVRGLMFRLGFQF